MVKAVRHIILATLIAVAPITAAVGSGDDVTPLSRIRQTMADSTRSDSLSLPQKSWKAVQLTLKELDSVETDYIEPQHYNWSVMMQATTAYDLFIISSADGQRLTLAPDLTLKLGPYFGWRWMFFGYTFDLKNIGLFNNKKKLQFDLSIYSSKIGVDIFYRRTGDDYKLRSVNLGNGIKTDELEGSAFDGVIAGITGIDAYYIFNHKRFSYPAAFSQSTLQKVSCGSFIAGAGYTRNSLSFDFSKLQATIDKIYGAGEVKVDSGLMFPKVKYHDISISAGYAYNFVLPHNWLLGISGQAALAYKKSSGNSNGDGQRGFQFDNINIDGIGRFGLVYNNMRWYTGTSLIVHTNNYRKARFTTSNFFGSFNIYLGYNFGLRKKYRNR